MEQMKVARLTQHQQRIENPERPLVGLEVVASLLGTGELDDSVEGAYLNICQYRRVKRSCSSCQQPLQVRCTYRDQNAGGIDRPHKPSPLSPRLKGPSISPSLAHQHEPDAHKREERKSSKLHEQSELDHLESCLGHPLTVLSRSMCHDMHGSPTQAENLNREGTKVEQKKQRRDPSRRDPELFEAAFRSWRDPPHDASKGHVASCSHEGRRHTTRACRVSLPIRVDARLRRSEASNRCCVE